MEVARYVSSTQSTYIVMQNIEVFYGVPVMLIVTSFQIFNFLHINIPTYSLIIKVFWLKIFQQVAHVLPVTI